MESYGIIAHGPMVPGQKGSHYPTRVVLRDLQGEYVTHQQVFEHDGVTHRGFSCGHYFGDLADAREDFSDRVKRGF